MTRQFNPPSRQTCLWTLLMTAFVVLAIILIAVLVFSPRISTPVGNVIPILVTLTPT